MSMEATREEEEEANMNLVCYNCNEEGHLQRDCAKNTKQTVQNTKASDKPRYQKDKREGKWGNRPQDGTNRAGDPQRRRPRCILCRKEGHTLTRCFIFERAQRILKTNYNDQKVRDFKRINSKNKEDKRLEELKVKFIRELDLADIGDTTVDMAVNCLLDEEELYEIAHVSIDEESAEENEEDVSGNEDNYRSEDEEEESDN